MLKWDISCPDTFRAVVNNCTFTIIKNQNNKYSVYIRAKIGDEFFEKIDHHQYDTLQEANEQCQVTNKRMNHTDQYLN